MKSRWDHNEFCSQCMHDLKIKVCNKAQVEGSITQACLIEEISNFCSMYFDTEIRTRRTQPPRNDDGGDIELNVRRTRVPVPIHDRYMYM
ncbi:hypothetical protein Taro_041035 [Colocasia esculenta]|uniref:DUF4218 domain-containing protein n=1 Tax=Colocasia esculenta TaxID=4460 RepID=A0A843WS78_COLES|nr:hypothetical protein [Colocasia esculenta]